MSRELETCPFCDKQPEVIFKNSPNNLVRCENRECAAQPSMGGASFSDFDELVKTWNTRVYGSDRGYNNINSHGRTSRGNTEGMDE